MGLTLKELFKYMVLPAVTLLLLLLIINLMGCERADSWGSPHQKCYKSHDDVVYLTSTDSNGNVTMTPVWSTVCDKYSTEYFITYHSKNGDTEFVLQKVGSAGP